MIDTKHEAFIGTIERLTASVVLPVGSWFGWPFTPKREITEDEKAVHRAIKHHRV